MTRRFIVTLLFFILCLSIVWIKLFTLQLNSHHSTIQSVLQREQSLTIDTGRADFFSRELKNLTGEWIERIALFPTGNENDSDMKQKHEQIERILNVPQGTWLHFVNQVNRHNEPRWFDSLHVPLTSEQREQLDSFNIQELRILPWRQRYIAPYYAAHVIGFINEDPERLEREFEEELKAGTLHKTNQIGAAGLEKTFQSLLHGPKQIETMRFVDALNRPLAGMNYRTKTYSNRFFPLKVVTTLDYSLQVEIEKRMDEFGIIKGGVIVLDVQSGDVLVSASRPKYNPYDVHPSKSSWQDRTLIAQPPGSIFKLIVAAAALEEGKVKPEETFVCNGHYGKYSFSCWKQHGRISFFDAVAQSCNITFAKVAERLTADEIESYATYFGVGSQIGWRSERLTHYVTKQFNSEQAGQVFSPSLSPHKNDLGVKIQTVIGQRDVQMSLLQATHMAQLIANNGRSKSPRIVSEIQYHNGDLRLRFPEQRTPLRTNKTLSSRTRNLLRQMMREVVLTGTASSLGNDRLRIAGKTGTAQFGERPGTKEHHWFVGYVPYESPKYAIGILVESVDSAAPHQAVQFMRSSIDIFDKHLE